MRIRSLDYEEILKALGELAFGASTGNCLSINFLEKIQYYV